jgi:hypothetical protein
MAGSLRRIGLIVDNLKKEFNMNEQKYYIEYEVNGRPYNSGPYKGDVILSNLRDAARFKHITKPRIVLADENSNCNIEEDFKLFGVKYKIGHEYHTDYPFTVLGDIPNKPAPVRKVKLLGFDGNKYCRCSFGKWFLEFKIGYLYELPSRMRFDEMINVPIEEVLTPDE